MNAVIRGNRFPFVLHLLDRVKSEQGKALSHDKSSGFTQGHSVHVNFDNLAGGAVFFDTVADVVELGEGRAHFVEVFAQRVQKEVLRDPHDDLGEAKQQFGQFHFFFVFQREAFAGGLLHLLRCHVGRSADAANPRVHVQQVDGRVSFIFQHLPDFKTVLESPNVNLWEWEYLVEWEDVVIAPAVR